MSKSNLRSRPPAITGEEREQAEEAFVAGAKGSRPEKKKSPKAREPYPWEEPYVREDVKKLHSVRLSEPTMLKLQYVAKHTGTSMNQFSVDAITRVIDAELKRMQK